MKKIGKQMAVIYGPPGTGKTTTLLKLVEIELFEKRVPIDSIALVTFTKAARQEAKDRLRKKLKNRLGWDQPKWWRTLHSMAFTMLGVTRKDMLSPKDYIDFGKAEGYDLSYQSGSVDADPTEVQIKTKDDTYRYVYEYARQRLIPVLDGPSICPETVLLPDYHTFCLKYDAWKKAQNKYDFNDLILLAIARGLKPDVTVAFIDEAQDLSPLLISACEAWFSHCQRVYVAGDDDQCIYAWSGADSNWLLKLGDYADDMEVLPQSYRVPSKVHAVAQAIIKTNTQRVIKTYMPRAEAGSVTVCERAEVITILKQKNVPCFILVRNRWCMKRIVQDLFTANMPYIVEGYGSRAPLANAKNIKALLVACKLKAQRPISGAELRSLLDVMPSRVDGKQLLPHGVKTKAKALKADHVSPQELSVAYGLGELLLELSQDVTACLKSEAKDTRAYFRALLASGYDLTGEPLITVTTIHGSKGREADLVIVIPDMTKKTFTDYRRDAEAENRCAYVAVTRCKNDLILVKPETIYHYDYRGFARC